MGSENINIWRHTQGRGVNDFVTTLFTFGVRNKTISVTSGYPVSKWSSRSDVIHVRPLMIIKYFSRIDRAFQFRPTPEEVKLLLTGHKLHFECHFEQVLGNQRIFDNIRSPQPIRSILHPPIVLESSNENDYSYHMSFLITSNPLPDVENGITLLNGDNCGIPL